MSTSVPGIDTLDRFQHDPLDTTRGQVRLLKLSPDLYEGDVQCSLYTVDLSTKPKHRALSYEWGPKQPLRRIRIGASSLSIRDNLWQFLTMFMKAEEDSGFLWIDQICIDQNNDQERNHQVQMIGTIYKNAKEVIVWLGLPDDRNSVVVKMKPGQIFSAYCGNPYCRVQHESPRNELCHWWPSDWRKYEFYDIIGKTYWTRLWIVQELWLAQSLRFYYAQTCLDTHEIIRCSWLAKTLNTFDEDPFYRIRSFHINRLLGITSPNREEIRVTLTDLLFDFNPASLQCTDPRDLIFGLLGLVHGSQQIPADYTLSNEQVFEAFLQKLVISPGLPYDRLREDSELTNNLDLLERRLGLGRDGPAWPSSFEGYVGHEFKLGNFISFIAVLENLVLVKAKWTMPQLARIASTAVALDDDKASCRRVYANGDVISELRELVRVLNTIEITELEESLQDALGEHRARRLRDWGSGLYTDPTPDPLVSQEDTIWNLGNLE